MNDAFDRWKAHRRSEGPPPGFDERVLAAIRSDRPVRTRPAARALWIAAHWIAAAIGVCRFAYLAVLLFD